MSLKHLFVGSRFLSGLGCAVAAALCSGCATTDVVRPGETVEVRLRLREKADSPVRVSIRGGEVRARENGAPTEELKFKQFDPGGFVTITPTSVEVPAGSDTATFSIKIKKDPGEDKHLAFLMKEDDQSKLSWHGLVTFLLRSEKSQTIKTRVYTPISGNRTRRTH